MKLKRLEMENFKSFGGRKLSLDLGEGFTAITGPNGSGKSNLVDAILFMLVPRSSKPMRARKLLDLIHNGGTRGRPAKFCKVAMTFDNKDRRLPVEANEVTFEREVRRNQKDPTKYTVHYRHNGRASSAGEFETLLSRAGVFADGYNIVQQGDITALSEMGGAERRRVIEEVAGIASFDRSLSKASSKKAAVGLDMALLMERRKEMERLLNQLKKEKEAAEKLRQVLTELEEVGQQLRYRQVLDLEQDIGSRRELIDDYLNTIEQGRRQLQELVTGIETTRTTLEEVEARIEAEGGEEARALQQALDEARVEQARCQETARHARERLKELERQQQAAARETTRLRQELGQTRRREQTAKEKLETLEQEQHEVRERFDALRAEAAQSDEAVGELQKSINVTRKQAEQAASKTLRLRLEVEGLQSRLERQTAEAVQARERRELAHQEAEQARWQVQDLKAGVDSVKSNLSKLKRKVAQRDGELEGFQLQLRELNPRIEALTLAQTRMRTERAAEELAGSGYPRAVRAVLEARDQDRLEGICGAVAELGSVEERYRNALSVAAGAKMQSVVVEHEQAAVEAIEFLKAQRAGRVRFLPLNRLSSRRPSAAAITAVRDEGALGFALDLARFDERYRLAFMDVFTDTVVMKDLRSARSTIKGARLVTLTGELLERGGAMVGGTMARQGLTFGRQEEGELERVTMELTAARKQQAQLQGRMNQVVEQLEALRTEYARLQGEQGSIQTRLSTFDNQTQRTEQALEKATEVLAQAQTSSSGTEEELQRADRGLQQALDDQRQVEELLENTQKELERLAGGAIARELAGLRERLHVLREGHGRHQTAFETATTQRRLLEERLEELEQTRGQTVEEQDRRRETAQTNETRAAELGRQVRQLREQEQKHFSRLAGLRKERDRFHDALIEQRSQRNHLEEQVATRQRNVEDLRLEIRKLELNLKAAQEALPADYQAPSRVSSAELLQDRYGKLERKREKLGQVNMLSLEHYEQEAERFEQLKAKQRELRREQRRMDHIIEKLEGRKTAKFMGVFNTINENLGATYEELTNGGKARLELERPATPFEGGLLIKVQPPHKKVYNMEALSGGEKSLVSMALIFAVQRFGPSPFYLLDEIDMNLDGVNTEHIGQTIAHHAAAAQFLVVSLHKSTLKEANHLIGVHMDGQGLSHLLTLRDVSMVDQEGNFSLEGAREVGVRA